MRTLPSHNRGETLISVLVSIGILTILTAVILTLIGVIYQITAFTKARTTAKNLAQDKLETIRNLPYDDVGTLGGVPEGLILQNEDLSLNGQNYHVDTTILFVDDPFDELAPTDTDPTDYKVVSINVTWGNIVEVVNPVALTTTIASPNFGDSSGTGTLSISVFDSNGDPVPFADVSIYSDAVTPIVDLTLQTDFNGLVNIPGILICVDCYQVSVTKDGYSTDKTYSTTDVTNPLKPHVTILENDLSEVSFSIDTLSTVNISTFGSRGSGFPVAGNVSFTLRGDKTIGTDENNDPVYKYSELHSTDGFGAINIEDIEWDLFTITPESPLNLSGANPISPFQLIPDSQVDLSMATASLTDHSLLLIFTDTGEVQVPGVSATISSYDNPGTILNSSSGLETDPDYGQLLFDGLTDGNYRLDATASGYLEISNDVYVEGQVRDQYMLQSN